MKIKFRAGAMAQELNTAVPEDLGWIPSTHGDSQLSVTPAPGDSVPSSGLHGHQESKQLTDKHEG